MPQQEAVAERQRATLLDADAAEGRTGAAELGLPQDQRAMRTGSQGPAGQPHGGNPATPSLAFIIHLASQKELASATEFLVVGKSRGRSGGEIGRGAGTPRAIGEFEPSGRMNALYVEGDIRGSGCAVVDPLRDRTRGGGGTQDPFPVIVVPAAAGRLG